VLLEKAASPNWQPCEANDQCAPRERVIFAIKSRGETIPDLQSEIQELKPSSVSKFSPRTIGAGWVDIDIDVLDAGLRSRVPRTGVPGAIAEPNVADL